MNLFSVSDGTYTLLRTGNFCHKCRRGRIQYINISQRTKCCYITQRYNIVIWKTHMILFYTKPVIDQQSK